MRRVFCVAVGRSVHDRHGARFGTNDNAPSHNISSLGGTAATRAVPVCGAGDTAPSRILRLNEEDQARYYVYTG
jgi:hypothetical protein